MKLRKPFREPAEVDLQISELFKDWQELSYRVQTASRKLHSSGGSNRARGL
jgi:hypothetical protein